VVQGEGIGGVEMPLKNVSGWRLNAQEKAEMADRVSAGECEADVKREIQERKAQAAADKKAAAGAVAQRCHVQNQQLAAKAKAKAKAKAAPQGAALPTQALGDGDIINKDYYLHVQADMQRILGEFGSEIQQELPLKIVADTDAAGNATGGIQEPFNKDRAATAIWSHGHYRCAVSIFSFNALQSATPSVPMSRRRVEELCEFRYGPTGQPRFDTERMVEVAIAAQSDLETEHLANLQVISPEEMLHSKFAGCARAIL
jgi:hypothetical protein